MLVAEIRLTQASFGMIGNPVFHDVGFEDIDQAQANYNRIAELIRRKNEKANDLPSTLELEGSFNKVIMPFDELRAISMSDYAKQNAALSGVREVYPNIFSK
jgi:hypothetical protein